MEQVINLPELGDGISEGTVISLLFKQGDTVKKGDNLIEIETDKAVLGVPINTSGTISQWHVKEGDNLKIGQKLCSITSSNKNNTTTEKPKEKNQSKSPLTEIASENKSSNKATTPESNPDRELEVNFTSLGDGIESGTVISLAVKLGDSIEKGDTLLELETDKAVVPFTSPENGIIKKILVNEGQKVKTGDKGILLTVKSTPSNIESGTTTVPETQEINGDSNSDNPVSPTKPQPSKSEKNSTASTEIVTPPSYTQVDFSQTHAGPATRKLARELGINLNDISGSGRSGRVTVDDVKNFTKSVIQSASSSTSLSSSNKELPDFTKWGATRKEKTSKLRETIATSISYSWQTIPHVHQHDNIIIDEITSLQKKWKISFEEKGSTLSVTPFIVKALAQCLKDFPSFNSSYNPSGNEIIFKDYFNIGVAVDTPQGLIVPVIKNVDQLTIFEIGMQLKTIAAQTRDRSVKLEDLQGACMTLSNLGGIGGAHFTPIINWPETAILGVARGFVQPVFNKEKNEFNSCMVLPACLAYDHRVIDGADGARFIVQLKQYLENPDLLLMGLK